MKNRRSYMRHLLPALAVLTSVVILGLRPADVAFAQASVPDWSNTGSLSAGRMGHSATLLPNGKILVVGGGAFPCSGNYCYSSVNSSAELYDPVTKTWSQTGSLSQRRDGHSATLLPNGQVLVAGGDNYGYDIGYFTYLNSAELYDPATGLWRATGSFTAIQAYNDARLLPNGKVLAVGPSNLNSQPTVLNAELYDPATGTWSRTASPSIEGRTVQLKNGNVMILSGNSVEVYDAATEKWSSAGSLNVIRFVCSATLLHNGKILVTGEDSSGSPFRAELYDPATGISSITGNLNNEATGTATLLSNGKVLIAGGTSCSEFTCVGLSKAELYDPATGKWSNTQNLNQARTGHTATLLTNGKVLVAGGVAGDIYDFPQVLTSSELYDPAANSTDNQIDDAQFFVRQHYHDFLNREPDAPGMAHWTNEITACNDPALRTSTESLTTCLDRKRANTSAAFFLSPEFQNTGSFVLRVYWGTLGKLPNSQCASLPSGSSGQCRPQYANYVADMNQVSRGIVVNDQLAPDVINANKHAFVDQFVNRPEFKASYDSLSNQQFVEKLFATTGISPTDDERSTLVTGLNNGAETRASTVFKVVDGTQTLTDGVLFFNTRFGKEFFDQEFDAAFVFMEYAGYLQRNPDQAGYEYWFGKLKLYGNWQDAQMVLAFILAPEYRQRFGQ